MVANSPQTPRRNEYRSIFSSCQCGLNVAVSSREAQSSPAVAVGKCPAFRKDCPLLLRSLLRYGIARDDLLHDVLLNDILRALVKMLRALAKRRRVFQNSDTIASKDLQSMFDGLMTAVTRRAAIPYYGHRYRGFIERLRRARDLQREWLFARIRRCRDTQFGRDHDFAGVRTLADFRRQVPVTRYDHFAPYIEAVARGEQGALFPADERVLRFTITTGSTGVPKLNPVTASWLKEYRNAWNLWGVKTLLDHPAQVGGKILQMAGTWNMGRTSAGIPISMVSALVARYQNQSRSCAALLCHSPMKCPGDIAIRRRALLHDTPPLHHAANRVDRADEPGNALAAGRIGQRISRVADSRRA